MAKYLAYGPSKPLLPIEFATNSFRPSSIISTATGQIGGNGEVLLGVKDGGENLEYILNEVNQTATPAPSPLPSSGCWRERRDETELSNKLNFPFLYPSSSSSNLDKKLIRKCWCKEDDDTSRAEGGGMVLISIKVAGDLFSGRARSTLAMKHLWDE